MASELLPPARECDVLTPSSLNRQARELIEGTFGLVWVEGEISNLARPASGHLYFTLKDAGAQVRCALFRQRAMLLRFKPADGAHVRVRAKVSLYEGRGEFQLIAEHMEEAGVGALQREFERLKARLAAEGLFAPERKRPLPRLPRRIGVITSPSGAAVRDVLSVIRRRLPLAQVEVLPVPVQGAEAPPAIVAMLNLAARAARYDVLLLTRGGGSLEDLWAFNDEAVARAIVASPVPVVSAVGHEIDFTIADFVADLRAPTPSAAAELLVPHADELRRELQRRRDRLAQHLARVLRDHAQRVDLLQARLAARRPEHRLRLMRQRAESMQPRLQRAIAARLERLRLRLTRDDEALRRAPRQRLERVRLALANVGRALHAISPLATLERGYAILLDRESGAVVRSTAQAIPGQKLTGRLADGDLPILVDCRAAG